MLIIKKGKREINGRNTTAILGKQQNIQRKKTPDSSEYYKWIKRDEIKN